jgi:hypothetical protein
VTGPVASGLRFSTKLLRRTIRLFVPLLEFLPADLQSLKPRDFIRRMLEDLHVKVPDNDPIPDAKDTEMQSRWVRLDLPAWLARRLAADEKERGESGRYPAWVILNTAMWTADGQAQRLLWAEHLRDLLAALLGVHDAGQAYVEIPQLRWLLLAPSGDMLPLQGVTQYKDDLTQFDFESDFAECVKWAWRAVDKVGEQSFEFLTALAGDLRDLHANQQNQTLTLRKFLASRVSGIIRREAQRMAGMK